MFFGDSASGVDAIQPWHLDVHQHEVGSERNNQFQGLAAINSSTNDVHLSVLCQQKAHHAQGHGRIVHDERAQTSIRTVWRHDDNLRAAAVRRNPLNTVFPGANVVTLP
jgi:hypothetical protein